MGGGEQNSQDPRLLVWAREVRGRSAACKAQAARAASSAGSRREEADGMLERLARHNPRHAEQLRAIRATADARRAATAEWKRGQPASRAANPPLPGPQDAGAAVVAGLEAYLRDMAAVAERDQIAAELQASVVQRIFAAGLTLQSAAGLTTQPEVSSRISTVVDGLDEIIHLIRNAIFNATGHHPDLP
jgi:signal transduction histidine kinase